MTMRSDQDRRTLTAGARPIRLPGILLGVGLGGFVDGILLHQILQWHHMLTSASTANIDVGEYPATTVHGLEMAPGSFPAHMYQHLLVGMYGPLALVLGAPVTLLLRSLPPRRGRVVGRILRSAPVGVVAHPVSALVLTLGGLAALYLTPLYVAATENPGLHHLVHLHFLLAGYLFAYAFAGPDPAPHRPSVPARLWLLGVAVAGHAVLAQLLYANLFVQVPVPAPELQGGASLMYFGGDVAELLVAIAMVATWRPHRANAGPPRRPVVLPA
ncbi:DUF2243 domain-containing protein [Isoptericola halotolerans]|uniref:DUF2243 domain-containing protein n=1 Tax=Isoptericola halotolerans TaxID=300560 RepID=UPI00388D761B